MSPSFLTQRTTLRASERAEERRRQAASAEARRTEEIQALTAFITFAHEAKGVAHARPATWEADYLYEVWSATLVHCGASGPSAAFGMCARDESEALRATVLVAGLPALGAVAGSLRTRHHRARAAAFGALWAGLIPLAVVLAMFVRVLSQR